MGRADIKVSTPNGSYARHALSACRSETAQAAVYAFLDVMEGLDPRGYDVAGYEINGYIKLPRCRHAKVEMVGSTVKIRENGLRKNRRSPVRVENITAKLFSSEMDIGGKYNGLVAPENNPIVVQVRGDGNPFRPWENLTNPSVRANLHIPGIRYVVLWDYERKSYFPNFSFVLKKSENATNIEEIAQALILHHPACNVIVNGELNWAGGVLLGDDSPEEKIRRITTWNSRRHGHLVDRVIDSIPELAVVSPSQR